jgi:hypothetical protein
MILSFFSLWKIFTLPKRKQKSLQNPGSLTLTRKEWVDLLDEFYRLPNCVQKIPEGTTCQSFEAQPSNLFKTLDFLRSHPEILFTLKEEVTEAADKTYDAQIELNLFSNATVYSKVEPELTAIGYGCLP